MALDEKVLWKSLWSILSGPSKFRFCVEGMLDRVWPGTCVTFKIKLKCGEEVELEISLASIGRKGVADGDLPGVEGHWWYFTGYIRSSQHEIQKFWKEYFTLRPAMRRGGVIGVYSTKLRKGFVRPEEETEYIFNNRMRHFPQLPGNDRTDPEAD